MPVIYAYGRQYGLSDFQASLLLTIFAAAQFLAMPVIGRLSDYFGRKPLLAISIFGTAIASFLSAFAPNVGILFLARALDGVTGGNTSVALAVISDTTKPQDRAKSFGMFGAAYGVAFILGPVISILAQQVSLSMPYVVAGVLALVATILTVGFLPETLQARERKPLSLGNLGFSQLITGLKLPVVGSILLLNFLSSLVFGIFTFGFQPYLINVLKVGTTEISTTLIVYGIVSAFMQAVALKHLLKRFKLVSLLLVSLLGTGIMMAALVLPQSYLGLLALIPFLGILSSLSRPVITSLISVNSRPEDQGVAMGLSESYFSLATAIGPLLGGVLVTLGYSTPLLATGLVGIIAFGYTYLIRGMLHEAPSIKEKVDF